MGSCKIDHSREDVHKKLVDQYAYLPVQLAVKIAARIDRQPAQAELNELFHLLKKYDLASEEERAERNVRLSALVE